MFCSKCGQNNADDAGVCTSCGTPLGQGQSAQPQPPPPTPPRQFGQAAQPMYQQAPPNIPNHLVWAILVTLFCCLPGGVVAIVYSSQVNSKLAQGDIQGAQQASNNAKIWSIVSASVGFVISILWLIFVVVAGISSN